MLRLNTARAFVAAATLAGAVAVAVGGCGGSAVVSPEAAVEHGLKAVDGIPQSGSLIGPSDAPVALTIFDWVTDLRLADVAHNELFDVIDTDVRRGKLKVQLRTTRFAADPDSEAGARVVQAAGQQGRFWQALAAFLPNYAGVIGPDDALQAFRTARLPSLPAAFADRQSPTVTAALVKADALALQQNARGRPLYRLRKTDGSTVDVTRDAESGHLAEAIAEALTG